MRCPPLPGPSGDCFTCREITTEAEFARLQPAWEQLWAQCAYPTPFCAWEWAWQWWQVLGKPDTLAYALRIILVSDAQGQMVGIAPFYFPTLSGRPLCLRPLRLWGTRIRCRGAEATEEPILLLRTGSEDAALRALLRHLARPGPRPWDMVHLRWMRRRDAPDLAEAWEDVRAEAGRVRSHFRTWDGQHVALPPSWPAFRASLSRSMRDNLPYYPRLLTRHGHEWRVRTARTPAEAADAARTLIRLHQARAESEAGTPHHDHLPAPSHQRFLREVLTALAARGLASVVLLEIGGVPVAAQAILEHQGVVTFHYSGFDPAWAAYSPITILNAHVLEDAIARGIGLADYLPEAEPWKARWGAAALYVIDELSWLPLRPRPLARAGRLSLLRAWQKRFGYGCDCGFCALPLTGDRRFRCNR